MFRFNHSFTSLLAVLLALTLFPFTALAVTENVLESAPDISLPEEAGADPGGGAESPAADKRGTGHGAGTSGGPGRGRTCGF